MTQAIRTLGLSLGTAIGAMASMGCGSAPATVDAGAGGDRAHSRVTAFVGVTVLTMEPASEAGARLDDQTVLVRSDRIERIGPGSRVPIPDGAITIDGRGKYLLPGLIDMHVHLAHAEQLPLYVARGVTAVRNMWGAPMHLAWRNEIEEGRRLGPTIRTAGPIVDGKDPVHEGSFVALTPSDADRAVLAHVAAGYDFVKAYSKLEPAVFTRLGERSRAARLPMVGHVPREVGLLGSLDAGELTIEHTNTFYDALQADGSPVLGKTDRASRQQWIDHLDESKLEAIAARFVERHAWACPTRVVMRSWEPRSLQLARLGRPEVVKYVLPSERAVWTPDRDPPEAEQKRNAREIEIADAIVRELHRRGVGLLAGTDVGNPLVVPGYALHDELAELVRLGLSPYQALRAATRDAAEVLGTGADMGTVSEGKRADLLLLGADPLAAIDNTTQIDGVMIRGRWIDAAEGAKLLEGVARWAQGHDDPFAGREPLAAIGTELFRATYRVEWKGTPFDTERMVVSRDAAAGSAGARVIRAETYDPHQGAWLSMTLWQGASGLGEKLILDADGATGRGRVEVTRAAGSLHATGTALSGDPISVDVPIDPKAYLVVDKLMAGKLVFDGISGKHEVATLVVSLGSTFDGRAATWKIATDAATPGRLEIDTGRGAPAVLMVGAARGDPPIGLSMQSHGAPLEWKTSVR